MMVWLAGLWAATALNAHEPAPPATSTYPVLADAPAPSNAIDLGLVISLTEGALVLGVDQDVMVHVALSPNALGPLGKLTIKSTAGEIIDVTRENDRAMSARWVLPARRFPQGAILVASTDEPVPKLGALCVPLPAVASPAFRTDPGAEVSLRVAGQMFGPKRANEDGDVRVPVIVPPGVEIAVALSINAHGKTAQETLSLGHPPFERMMLWAPATATLGTPTVVWAFGIDAAARPLAGSAMSVRTHLLTASGQGDGTTQPTWAQPMEGGAGWARFLLIPPSTGLGQRLSITAFDVPARTTPAGPPVHVSPRAQTQLALLAGPAARFVMIPNRMHMTVGSTQSLVLVVRAEDAFGNATSAHDAKVYVDGSPTTSVTPLDGPVRVVVPAPPDSLRPSLRIEAVGKTAYAVHEIILDRVIELQSERPVPKEREQWASATLRASSLWTSDAGTGFAAWLDGEFSARRMVGWPQDLFVTATAAYVERSKVILAPDSLSRLNIRATPIFLGARWRARPARGVSIFLGAAAGGARVFLQSSTFGAQTSGQAWVPAVRLSADLALGRGVFQMVLGISYCEIPGARLSSQDSLRGNLGGWEIGIGARRRW